MKERQILFTGEMVRAILDGRKTQTRRVINPQPKHGFDLPMGKDLTFASACPYGQPGDRLWVRETWAVGDIYDKDAPRHLPQPDDVSMLAVDYAANAERVWSEHDQGRWRPSIHMPRWASRIILEIESVRVERVQEITQADARAEGVESEDFLNRLEHAACVAPDGAILPSPRSEFEHLWDSINAKRGFGWDVNPWVWVINFRRCK